MTCCEQEAEPPIRYTLFGDRIGTSTVVGYVRSLVGFGLWVLAAPLPARLLARIGAHQWSMRYQRWWAKRLARTVGMRLDISGLEHVGEEAYVVTPLHEGLADAVALLHLPLPLRFVLRDEFIDWRPLGGYLRGTGQIAIRPEDGTQAYRATLRGARAALDQGASVVICPQGTILGVETDFQPGAFAIARALGRPILPVALTGTHRVWEFPFSPRLRRGERASMRVLPPIPPDEVRARSLDDVRLEAQRRIKAAALDGTMAPARHYLPARDGTWDGYAFEIDPTFPELAADVAAHRRRRNASARDDGCVDALPPVFARRSHAENADAVDRPARRRHALPRDAASVDQPRLVRDRRRPRVDVPAHC